MFKRMGFVLVSLALVGAVALAGVWVYGQASRPALAQTTETPTGYSASRIITVVGQGTARVQPDIAQISIGVETIGATVSEAVKENNAKMQTILDALKKAGIPDKDVQTSNYSISVDSNPQPVPQPVGGTSEPTKPQYRVSNMVTVTIRDLTKVGSVLDSVVEAGANSIWGVSFSVDDPKVAQADARTKAIADAQARALALAQLGGVKLGPILSMSEVMGSSIMPVAARMDVAMAWGGASVSPGEVEVGYQVQVAYYIQP